MLPKGQGIGQRLTGMIQITERIDDGNRGRLGKLHEGVMLERSRHDDLHPALQVTGVIADRLALAEAIVLVIQVDGRAAELRESHLETHARSQ